MAARTVYIVDAEHTNPNTGVPHSSQVYHYAECGNLVASTSVLEVEEKLARQFGRRLCTTCRNAEQRDQYLKSVHQVLKDKGWPSLNDLAASVPDGLEVRLYITGQSGQNAKKLWSSKGT